MPDTTPQSPDGNPRVWRSTTLWFVVVYLVACTVWISETREQFLPPPVYERHIEGSLGELYTLTSGETLGHQFRAPGDSVSYIQFRPFKAGPLRVRFWNRSRAGLLTDQLIDRDDAYRATFEPDNEAGDLLEIQVSWDTPAPPLLGVPWLIRPDATEAEELQPPASSISKDNRTPLQPGVPHEIKFSAPQGGSGIENIRFPGLIADDDHRVRLDIVSDRDGKSLRGVTLRSGRRESGELNPPLAPGESATATLRWDPAPARIPLQDGVVLAELSAPTGAGQPAYLLGYRRDQSPYLIWWLPAVLLGGVAARWKLSPPNQISHWEPAAVAFFAFAAATTGVLAWQQLYTNFFPFTDPDRYAQYGERIAAALRGTSPDGIPFREWSASYFHTHIPLTPAVLAIAVSLGLPLTESYLWLAMVCTGVAAWVLYRLLRSPDGLGIGKFPALLTIVLFVTNVGVLRASGSTSTDAPGILLVTLTLAHLLRRSRTAHRRDNLTLGLLILLNALSRPGAPAYAIFFAGAAVLADAWREGRLPPFGPLSSWRWKPFFVTPMVLAAPSVLVLLAVGVPLGWHDTFTHSGDNYDGIKIGLTSWSAWTACILAAGIPWLLIVPVTVWLARGDCHRRHELLPPLFVGTGWAVFFTVLFGILAVHILRIFVPVTPGLVIAAAPGFACITACAPRVTTFAVAIFAAAGIIAALWSDTIAVWIGVPLFDGLLFPLFLR